MIHTQMALKVWFTSRRYAQQEYEDIFKNAKYSNLPWDKKILLLEPQE